MDVQRTCMYMYVNIWLFSTLSRWERTYTHPKNKSQSNSPGLLIIYVLHNKSMVTSMGSGYTENMYVNEG